MSILASAGAAAMGETSQFSTVMAEEREQQQAAARRDRAEERRLRFLDSRTRTIGIDVDFLDKQVREKEEAKRRAKEADMRYAAEQAAIERELRRFEGQVEASKKRQVAQNREAWRRQQAAKAVTAEYKELQDKNALTNGRPARMGDHDPACGPASMQKFDGEDLREAERRALQAAQMREWVQQQKTERISKMMDDIREDREYARYLADIEEQRKAADAIMTQVAAQEMAELKQTNAALMAKNAARAKAEKEADAKASEDELAYMMSKGALLAEDPSDAVSALGPNRIRRDHYRGMTAEQAEAYNQRIQEQIAAKKAAKEAERRAQLEEGAALTQGLRMAARAEAQIKAQEDAERAQFIAQLKQQRELEQSRKLAQASESKESGFSDGFFNGFGQSDR